VLGMSRLRTLIPVSLLFALFSLCAPSALIYAVIAVFGLESPLTHRFLPFIAHYLVFIFLVIWLVFLTAAIKQHGRRGLWLLVGLPLVGFLPVTISSGDSSPSNCP